MKLSEVIKILEEDSSKKFSSINSTAESDGYHIRFKEVPSFGETFLLSLDRDWEEVKQLVTWQKAIEEWANGKEIHCVFNGYIYRYSNYGLFTSLGNNSPTKDEIKNGKWYIEEGNNE